MKKILFIVLAVLLVNVFGDQHKDTTLNIKMLLVKSTQDSYGINWGSVFNESQYSVYNGGFKIIPSYTTQAFTVKSNSNNINNTFSEINSLMKNVAVVKQVYFESTFISSGKSYTLRYTGNSNAPNSNNLDLQDVLHLTINPKISNGDTRLRLSASIKYVNSFANYNDKLVPLPKECKSNINIDLKVGEVAIISSCRVNYNNFLISINKDYNKIQNSAIDDAKLIFLINIQ